MKIVLKICLLFFFSFSVKAQLLFYQDTYRGGVTSDGYSYFGLDYLQADSIIFQTHIANGSIIRKSYLLFQHHVLESGLTPKKDSPLQVNFNNTLITLDSSYISTNMFYSSFSVSPDEIWITVKDVTTLTQQSNNKLIIPNQTVLMINDTGRHYVYDGFILVIMYENNTMPVTNSAIFLNNQTFNNSMTHNFNNINPIDNSKDVGLSIWVNNAYTQVDTNQKISYTLQSTQGLYPLGKLNGWNGHVNKKTLPGSFYYENSTLFGLVDDINSPLIDSTDAIANIKTYVANNTITFNLVSNTNKVDGVNYSDAFVLAYTTPCPARSNKDTTIGYAPICSGNSVPLNNSNASVGSYTWSAANNSLNNYNIPSPIASPSVTTTYIALIDSNGCKHTEHFKVNVYSTPKTDSVKTTVGICGNTVSVATIITPIGSPTSYTVNGMVQSSPTFTNLAVGTYTFALSNNFGCSFTSPKPFIIKDTNMARASFRATPDSGCAPLSITAINKSNYQGNFTNNYVWYVNGDSATTQNLNYTFSDTGKYVITLFAYETLRNCSATATQTILVKDCPPPPPDSLNIIVPNIFSPNADGINEAWQLTIYNFNYTISNYACTIYDRWGTKVFETSNISEAWSGRTTSGLPCSAGTYYYIIKLSAINSKGKSEDKDFKGYLELVR